MLCVELLRRRRGFLCSDLAPCWQFPVQCPRRSLSSTVVVLQVQVFAMSKAHDGLTADDKRLRDKSQILKIEIWNFDFPDFDFRKNLKKNLPRERKFNVQSCTNM